MSRDTWAQITTWGLVLPPSRPHTTELNRIRAQIASVDRCEPVAILGSTPEFRDLLASSGFEEVELLERNPSFARSVEALRTHQSDDRMVIGNWLDLLPAANGRYSIILSDLTSGNVPYEDRATFYRLIAGALRPGGLFIDKVLMNSRGLIPLSHLRAKYADLPLNLQTVNDFSCEAIFCSELLKRRDILDTNSTYRDLEDELGDTPINAFIDAARLITPNDCTWYYGRSWDRLKSSYGGGLKLLDEAPIHPELVYHGHASQFVWQKER